MDYMKPKDVAIAMVDAGTQKAGLAARDLLVRGVLSGAILGFATSLAIGATVQTGQPIVGAIIFPVGFVMIVLLGLELVTGSFALVPLALIEGKASAGTVLANWSWVFLGNLIGALLYAGLYAVAISKAGTAATDPIMTQIVNIAQAKTLGYKSAGLAGMATVFVKAILCNWMVCLGVVMGMTSSSTVGKIAAAWLPIVVFFGQGFEHSVVNMFVIPVGMLLGAKVSVADWWLWNQIPVTLGNIVGGFAFTGFALYFTYRTAPAKAKAGPAAEAVPAAAE
jgi:formate/nitrite transporter